MQNKIAVIALIGAISLTGCVEDGSGDVISRPVKTDIADDTGGYGGYRTGGYGGYRDGAAPVGERGIGDGLAQSQCDTYARRQIRYPIKRLATSRVSGDFEKTVNLSYSVDKSGDDPRIINAFVDVVCKFRGRRLSDFTMR